MLAATDSAAVAGVDEATPVARTTEAGRTTVDVAAGAEDHPLFCAVSRWIVVVMAIILLAL
eukprot:4490093-Pleurochrysis_carterae.AAC.2